MRIYALDVEPDALVAVTAQPANDVLDFNTFFDARPTLINGRCSEEGECTTAYAEVDIPPVPASAGVNRIVINVTLASGRSFAFATVTNNATQAVTTVPPR